jgi:predicted RNA-binding protein with RPS1 domain
MRTLEVQVIGSDRKGGITVEIIRALKAEQKVLEKKLKAIQVTLKTTFDKFYQEQPKKVSAKKASKKAAKKKGYELKKTAKMKEASRKSTRHAPHAPARHAA